MYARPVFKGVVPGCSYGAPTTTSGKPSPFASGTVASEYPKNPFSMLFADWLFHTRAPVIPLYPWLRPRPPPDHVPATVPREVRRPRHREPERALGPRRVGHHPADVLPRAPVVHV